METMSCQDSVFLIIHFLEGVIQAIMCSVIWAVENILWQQMWPWVVRAYLGHFVAKFVLYDYCFLLYLGTGTLISCVLLGFISISVGFHWFNCFVSVYSILSFTSYSHFVKTTGEPIRAVCF